MSIKFLNTLVEKIFNIETENQFQEICYDIFKYQFQNNKVYNQYINYLGVKVNNISEIEKIPCLPIEFFKTQKVVCNENNVYKHIFTSSGTTGMQTSKHYICDINIYEKSFTTCFTQFYGDSTQYSILALLPSYLERQGSSLIYMADYLIKKSRHKSGFFLYNYNELIEILIENEKNKIPTILLGVTFALIQLAQNYNLNLENTIIIETGGMKGQGKELTRQELHQLLRTKLGCQKINSEYGMTELLSQAYSNDTFFETPNWLKIFIRDTNDPFNYVENNKTGGINIIDLANINSCSFIETKDLGRKNEKHNFEVLGRFDNSEIRGCNLLVL